MNVFQGFVTLWISLEQFFQIRKKIHMSIWYHIFWIFHTMLVRLRRIPKCYKDSLSCISMWLMSIIKIILLMYQVLVIFYLCKSRSKSAMKLWNHFFCTNSLLFVWSLSSHSRIFHSYGDVIIAGVGLQILTNALHSWTLSEGSLTCHTYCDKGLPFIMVISEDPWHLYLLPRV